MEFIEPYQITVLVLGLTGALFWLQLAVVDVVAIKLKHTPGFNIEQNHNRFLFRANRAFANSNESVGILVLLTLFAILSAADASWLNTCSIVYLVGRCSHMLCYYFNFKAARSASFAISFCALLAIFVVGLQAWL